MATADEIAQVLAQRQQAALQGNPWIMAANNWTPNAVRQGSDNISSGVTAGITGIAKGLMTRYGNQQVANQGLDDYRAVSRILQQPNAAEALINSPYAQLAPAYIQEQQARQQKIEDFYGQEYAKNFMGNLFEQQQQQQRVAAAGGNSSAPVTLGTEPAGTGTHLQPGSPAPQAAAAPQSIQQRANQLVASSGGQLDWNQALTQAQQQIKQELEAGQKQSEMGKDFSSEELDIRNKGLKLRDIAFRSDAALSSAKGTDAVFGGSMVGAGMRSFQRNMNALGQAAGFDPYQKELQVYDTLEALKQPAIQANYVKGAAGLNQTEVDAILHSAPNLMQSRQGLKLLTDMYEVQGQLQVDYADARAEWRQRNGGSVQGFDQAWSQYVSDYHPLRVNEQGEQYVDKNRRHWSVLFGGGGLPPQAPPAQGGGAPPTAGGPQQAPPSDQLPPANSIEGMISQTAQKYGVPAELALAVARQESGLNQSAVSPKGAIGVMQLMPGTAQELGVDPNDLAQNIDGGVRYLAQMLQQFNGDPQLALAAYNAGPGAVRQAGGVPNYPETQNYVQRISQQFPPQQGQGTTRLQPRSNSVEVPRNNAIEGFPSNPKPAPKPQPKQKQPQDYTSAPWSLDRVSEVTRDMSGPALQTLTFGRGDEIVAAIKSVANNTKYFDELKKEQADLQRFEKLHPWAATASGLAGSVPAIKGSAALMKGATWLSRALRSVGVSAGLGAAYGSGQAQPGERVAGAVKGAKTGAALGLVAPGLEASSKIPAIAARISEFVSGNRIPTNAKAPEIQKALQLVERQFPGTIAGASSDDLAKAVELASKQAKALPENIIGQLGGLARENQVEKALYSQLEKHMPRLIQSGIFDKAQSVDDMVDIAKNYIKANNMTRGQTVKILDDAAVALNKSNVAAGKELVGALKPEDIKPAVDILKKRMTQLRASSFTKPIADSIDDTIQKVLNDLKVPKGNKPYRINFPGKIVDMLRDLNEARRNLIREFDSTNLAKVLDKNSPSYAQIQDSIEAIRGLQKGLTNALEKQVQTIAAAGKLKVDPKVFTNLNDEYGAYQALISMGEKFSRGVQKGRAVRDATALIQNQGPGVSIPVTTSVRGAAVQMLADQLGRRQGQTQALAKALATENASANSIKNIQDMIALNRSQPQLATRPNYVAGMLRGIEGAMRKGAPLLPAPLAQRGTK